MSSIARTADRDSRPLVGKRVVLCVSGGIAAYKAIEICRRLVDAGAHVAPVLTEAALRFVGEVTFTALASEPAHTSLWDDDSAIPHTRLGQNADVVVVAPATANTIAKYTIGMAEDLLGATLLATRAPVVICPAMHTEMWEQGSVQDNLALLTSRGVTVVPPDEGRLAGGDLGAGRLAAPEKIVAAVIGALLAPEPGPLAGQHVLITAGGTREQIDPVRFIGNRSTGKQGYALAGVAADMGATVTLISTVDQPAPPGVAVVEVVTAAEMHDAVMDRRHDADIVIMAAAVADFTPVTTEQKKLKKADGVPELRLERTVDILAALGADKRPGQLLVGFAAETDDLIANAASKLDRKGADFIVANDVSAPGVGFGHDTNAVTILSADGESASVALASKRDIARAVLTKVMAAQK